MDNIKGYLPNIHNEIYCAYKSTLNRRNWYATNQCSKFSRFYFVEEGECLITINGVEYVVGKNDLILIPAGCEYSYRIIGSDNLVKLWCHFNSTMDAKNLFDLINCDYLVKVKKAPHMAELFNKLVGLAQQTFTIVNQLQQQIMLAEILEKFLEFGSYSFKEQSDENSMRYNRVITYMRTHLYEDISVDKLASLVHMNPNYFIQKFTKNYGISPIKMFNKIKMDAIIELLRHSDIHMSEIAASMGFSDMAYFSRYVKKYLGMSPKVYRNSINKKEV